DAGAAPGSRTAVEIEEQPCGHPRFVLEQEMCIEHDGLGERECGTAPVQMPPPSLYHSDPRVGEARDDASQKVGRRHEVGIEYGDDLASRTLQPLGQRSRLESIAVTAMYQLDPDASSAPELDSFAGARQRLVRGVVQYLDLQQVCWVVQRRPGV